MNETEKILNEAMFSSLLAINNIQLDNECSKVSGRENYIIHICDGKVDFYGTKRQFLDSPFCGWVLLKEAYRYNTFKFTYKKDWLEMLKKLGVEV